ncbi:MAG: DegV family protein [Parasporobacterium sp.]|nr:DegV family protein [Parasporobacterium sp.]
MKDFTIFGDSTCDLTEEYRSEAGIEYLEMKFSIDDREYSADLDWKEMSPKEFYDTMRSGKRITTTQVPMETFERKFTDAITAGKDILYISCSSALSKSVNAGMVAARELMEKYPETRIRIVDSLESSFGQGLMLLKAAALRKEGKSVDETADIMEAEKLTYQQCGTVEKLDYLKRAGRVTASSAFFGNIIGIKPIIISDALGQNYAIKKVKGAGAAKEAVVQYVAENIVDSENQYIYLAHADAKETAEAYSRLITEKINCKGTVYGNIGPIVGASVGPGTIICYFVGKSIDIKGEA